MFAMAITLYALFGDDARLAMAHKEADDYFYYIASVVLILFIIELLITSLGKEGYLNSFNFWLDAVATATVVFDIGWIFGADDGVLDNHSSGQSESNDQSLGESSIQNLDQSRNARVLRLVRLLRLVRVAKLWKIVMERQKSKQDQREALIDRSLQVGYISAAVARLAHTPTPPPFPDIPSPYSLPLLPSLPFPSPPFRSFSLLQHLVKDFTMDELMERFTIADKEGYGHLNPTQMKYLLMSTIYATQHARQHKQLAGEVHAMPTEKQAALAVDSVTDTLFSRMDKAKDGLIHHYEFKQGILELQYQTEEKKERENMNALPPSLVGQQMVDLTTKRVILLVLALLLFLPLVNQIEREAVTGLNNSGLSMLHVLLGQSGTSSAPQEPGSMVLKLLHTFVSDTNPLYLQLQGGTERRVKDWLGEAQTQVGSTNGVYEWSSIREIDRGFRGTELMQLVVTTPAAECAPAQTSNSTNAVFDYRCSSMVIYDIRSYSQEQARSNMYQTLFVMFLLCIGTVTLSRDAKRLVISPIERMVHLVQRLAMDPLARITTHNPVPQQQQGKQQGSNGPPNGYNRRGSRQVMPNGGSKFGSNDGASAFGREDPTHWNFARESSTARLGAGSGQMDVAGGSRAASGATHGSQEFGSRPGRPGWRGGPKSPRGARDAMAQERQDYKGSGSYETHLLESTLTKIAGLVQIGFGSAGASIIKQNMGHHGAFDPMVRGRKVFAVFGFCDIRKFTDTTECLKEEVMVFTNKIGSIVHNAVHHFEGAANKNIGDAFLMVWKIEKGSTDEKRVQRGGGPEHLNKDRLEEAGAGGKKSGMVGEGVNSMGGGSMVKYGGIGHNATMADNALTAFIKCMVDIRNSDELAEYRDNRLLMRRFDYPYIVKLGYGLHVGWAIEGAIGSLHKIDASYLSPDVNMSSRLEAATKQYGVPLLMSHSFYSLLSDWNQQHVRCIDCVTVKGSTEPLGLYTCDVTRDRILSLNSFEDMEEIQEGLHPQVGSVYYAPSLLPSFPPSLPPLPSPHHTSLSPSPPLSSLSSPLLTIHTSLVPFALFLPLSVQFFPRFDEGLQAYFRGGWADAKGLLEKALELKPEDGPIKTLLAVIEVQGPDSPADWKGYRELTEK
jgi:class 3 adenylate cyclase